MIYHDQKNMFSLCYWLENDVVVAFKVFEIVGIEDSYKFLYRKKETPGCEFISDITDAELLISGNLKWDGCIDFKFPSQDFCMLHACQNPGKKFKAIFDAIYGVAADIILTFDGE